MTAMVAEDLAQIPMSPYLAASLQRAAQYAEAQAHQEVTLEHVLLALAEDPEASVILRSSNVDVARLQTDVSNHLGNIAERQDPANQQPVRSSNDLQRILEAAAEAAKQGRRPEINGAILLAAIVGDGGSTAAHILRAQGLTFEATIAALRNSVQQPPRPQTPPQAQPAQPVPPQGGDPTTADEVLAEARARVNNRRTPENEPTQPSIEPQWEQAAPSAEMAAQDESAANDAPQDANTGSPDNQTLDETNDPIPTGVLPTPPPVSDTSASPPAAGDSGAEHWAPPQPPPEKPARPPAPRLQRVPPPLPPDAGLRPPRSQSAAPVVAPSPTPPQPVAAAPAEALPSSPLPPAPPPIAGSGQRSQHVPPWVGGDAGQTRTRPPGSPQPPHGRAPVEAHPGRPRSTQIKVETGQMVENIPRKMKAGVSELVEVRIARANVKALAQGLQGGGAAYKHEAMITKAMSVKLRAPDGGFWVEAASPETQWIENVLGVMTDDFASWRWTVTPKSSGQKKLQLVVSARTVGSDGLAAETALPDQLFDVRVAVNYGQKSKRAAGWLAAAIFGGVLARFGEGAFDAAKGLIEKMSGG